jgi:hypothetical protein
VRADFSTLVDGKTTLKNMSSSVGMMTLPIYGKIKFMFQTTNQYFSKKNVMTRAHPNYSEEFNRRSGYHCSEAPTFIPGALPSATKIDLGMATQVWAHHLKPNITCF